MLNLQGPRMPARTREVGIQRILLAGPYEDAKHAGKAIQRLRVALEMDGKLITPEDTLKLGDRHWPSIAVVAPPA